MKTRSKPSRFRSRIGRSFGSNACASTPFSTSAFSTALPESKRYLALRRRASHQHRDLAEAVLPAHASPMICTSGTRSTPVRSRTVDRTCAMIASISAAFAAPVRVDDEIRVLLRHACAADRVAFEAAALDQARGVVAGRIAEDAAGVRQVERLRRDSPAQELRDPLARDAAVAARKRKPRRSEHRIGQAAVRAAHGPVSDGIARRGLDRDSAAARHDLDARDVAPRLAAVAAGVHRERTADRARDPGEELGARETVRRGEARDLGARDARFRVDQPVDELQRNERRVQHDDRAADDRRRERAGCFRVRSPSAARLPEAGG